MGNPFIALVISSPDNLAKLEYYREISRKLTYPFELDEDRAKELASKGRAIVAVSAGIHATEVAGTQMLIELVYELATREDLRTIEVLKNIILVVLPCLNPDGQIMVVDWYYKCLGTEYEGWTHSCSHSPRAGTSLG
ncbi:MAG: hypothetical protein DRJ57_00570 [Thermoprotei archaeon]|nr:MAG: hypothetical protein DRJ57_00570 [Thermoprotei archaeon]